MSGLLAEVSASCLLKKKITYDRATYDFGQFSHGDQKSFRPKSGCNLILQVTPVRGFVNLCPAMSGVLTLHSSSFLQNLEQPGSLLADTKVFPYCVNGPEQGVNFSPKVDHVFAEKETSWGQFFFLLENLKRDKTDRIPRKTKGQKLSPLDYVGPLTEYVVASPIIPPEIVICQMPCD